LSDSRKIVLHIGLHKTGTTTIQNVLHANRDFLLRREGVLYPSLTPNLSTALLTIFRDDPRKLKIDKVAGLTGEEMAARRKKFLNSLDAEISSREWDTLLLSAEGVCLLTAPEMARLREWGEKYSSKWLVLVCVRHPVDWTRSAVQQRLNQGDTLRQLYEKPPMPKYRVRISRAISVFGLENVRVFDFESAVAGEGGIVGAFAEQAGLSAPSRDFLASRTGRYNESFSLEAARILDSLNRQRPIFVDNVRAPRRVGPELDCELDYIRRIKGQKFDVPDSVKENIRSLNRDDIAWLNETFGLDLYRDVTGFAPHAQSHEEEPVEALSDPTVDSIAEIIDELVETARVQGQNEALKADLTALRNSTSWRLTMPLRAAKRLATDPRGTIALLRARGSDVPAQPKKLLEEATAKQPGRFTRWLKP